MQRDASAPIRVLSRDNVRELLDVPTCIAAVEAAFRLHAEGASMGPGVLGTHVVGGGFHVKAAGISGSRAYYAAKVNANFPDNPRSRGLPTIQGVIALFDATNGLPLAILDSIEITCLRTAASSAVAAKYLSRDDARVLTIIGCGAQGLPHVRALGAVRALKHVFLHDIDGERATALMKDVEAIGISAEVTTDYRAAVSASDMIVTCTPGRAELLGRGDLASGTFLAAVGADSENKRELDPQLLADSVVVVDILEQCASIGELHHALEAGVMTRDDVRGELAGLVSGAFVGRQSRDEIAIFDSTGTALQDVAAAAVVYERACEVGAGTDFPLSS
jgi:ornithine cyclodeaminase/alanine dehydrogenase-like protein (mu-crystallin family)